MMIESQIEYVLQAVKWMRKQNVTAIEPTLDAEKQYFAELQDRMRNTVWVSGGCQSWYLDKSGTNSTLWPSSVPAFQKRLKTFDPSVYRWWA
jgi:hypothetical protein